MHKKYHEKFKILDILAVTTQAREGIETEKWYKISTGQAVTTQAREGIERMLYTSLTPGLFLSAESVNRRLPQSAACHPCGDPAGCDV